MTYSLEKTARPRYGRSKFGQPPAITWKSPLFGNFHPSRPAWARASRKAPCAAWWQFPEGPHTAPVASATRQRGGDADAAKTCPTTSWGRPTPSIWYRMKRPTAPEASRPMGSVLRSKAPQDDICSSPNV